MLWFARVAPRPRSPITGLAIVGSGSACYLFGCDAQWGSVFDTWHPTLERAKEHAAADYQGVKVTWLTPHKLEET